MVSGRPRMRLARRLAPSVSALLVACVVAAAAVPTGNPAGEPPLDPAGAPPPPFPPGPSTQDVELQCPLTLSQGDPACLNGGVVLTDTGEDNEAGGHCARCWCPAGWAGVLCGQCSADSACEAAGGGRCDTGAVLPPARGAARDGYVHELSCECGSDSGYDDVDGQTNWICSLQKGTTLTLQARKAARLRHSSAPPPSETSRVRTSLLDLPLVTVVAAPFPLLLEAHLPGETETQRPVRNFKTH